MPAPDSTRQVPPGPRDWFDSARARSLVIETQRQAQPLLSRVFGRWGLHLQPSAQLTPPLTASPVHQQVCLHRHGEGFDGALRCAVDLLPLANECLALVYVQHVLETLEQPEGLIAEKVALEVSHNAEQLTMNLKGIFLGDDRKIVR